MNTNDKGKTVGASVVNAEEAVKRMGAEDRAKTINGLTDEGKAEAAKAAEEAVALVQAEDAVLSENEQRATAKAGDTWNGLKAVTRRVLGSIGHKGAALFLDTFKAQAAVIGGRVKGRAAQYAANLNRAVKATDAGKEVPAELWDKSRTDWLDSPFWKNAGILSNRGAKKGSGKAGTEAGKVASVGAAAVAATKPADDLAELLELVNAMAKPVRAEWIARSTESARALLKKSEAMSGGSR